MIRYPIFVDWLPSPRVIVMSAASTGLSWRAPSMTIAPPEATMPIMPLEPPSAFISILNA